MSLLASILFALLSTADAVATLLNSPSACSPEQYATASRIVEEEAVKGQPLQQFVVGVLNPEKEKSRRYLEKARPVIQHLASAKDNPMAWYLLSMEKNDMRLLRTAAKGGNVQALNALGTIVTQQTMENRLLSSNDVSRILRECFGHFQRAAAQNDANGFVNLGACYLNGLGCERDLAMAFTCFKSAADLGHPEGMENLSAAYALGHGVAKDVEQSAVWRMRAKAVRGDETARKWVRDRERLKDKK